MGKFLRRLRGIFGTGLTWAVGWAAFTVGTNLLFGIPLRFVGLLAVSGVVRGFIAGGAFAVILSFAERHHTLEDLSLRRVGLWGGIGGSLLLVATLPFVLSLGIPLVPRLVGLTTSALLGAGFASGSVALARRGEPRLLDGGQDPLVKIEGG